MPQLEQHRLDLGVDPARLLASLLPTPAMRESWTRGYLAFGTVRCPQVGYVPDWAMLDAARQIWTDEERAELEATRAAAIYATPSWTVLKALQSRLAERVAPDLAREWRPMRGGV